MHRTRSSARLAAASITALSLALPQLALAKDEPATDSRVEALRTCQAMTDATARLACFDSAASAIVTASDQGELRIVDREEVRETRRKLFGFTLPDFGIFGGRKDDGPEEEKITVLNTTITKVRPSDRAGWVITTAEGAVWQIDNVPRRLMTPKVGQAIEIRDAALSAYFLRIDGQPGVKGYRVR